jgi:hypothetical protein
MMADAICATLTLPESENQLSTMPDLPIAEIALAPWEACFD